MNTAIDFYSRGKEKEAEANEYTLPGFYPMGRFICPECGEEVFLSRSKYKKYKGPVTKDFYGRSIPKHARGTENLSSPTSSGREITKTAMEIYKRTVDPELLIRRITLVQNHVIREDEVKEETYQQLDLFTDYAAGAEKREAEKKNRDKERRLQEALLSIRKRYGNDAMLRGLNLQEGATGRDRAKQIGGHKA